MGSREILIESAQMLRTMGHLASFAADRFVFEGNAVVGGVEISYAAQNKEIARLSAVIIGNVGVTAALAIARSLKAVVDVFVCAVESDCAKRQHGMDLADGGQ